MTRPLRAAVFASGGGSNLQALIDHVGASDAPSWNVALVVTDRPGAGALARAERHGIRAEVVSTRPEEEADEPAPRLLPLLDEERIDFVLLAGYLKLVPPTVVARYAGRILNIHPALLPAFGGKGMYGMHVHRAVLESGARVTGATVHLVDEVYDRGPILAQWPVPVLVGDTPEDVAARVLEVEHRLYPRVVDHVVTAFARGGEATPMDPPDFPFPITHPIEESR